MIPFRCPHCHAALSAPAERAGRRSTCPSCKRRVQVPGGPLAALPLAPGERPAAPPVAPAAPPVGLVAGPARPGRRRTRIVLATLGLGCLAAVVTLGFKFGTSRRPADGGAPQVAPDDRGSGPRAGGAGGGKAAPAAARERPRPAPVLSVAVNGGGRPRAYRGWPLLVRARLLHPNAYARDGKVEPLVLAAAAGPWSAAVRLEVHDQRGEALRWPFHLVAQGAPALALDAQTGGDLTWYLAPEETAALPAGDCTLVARLDTRDSAAPGGWKGARSSETVRLAVGEGPAALSPEQEATKYVLLAEYARLRGDPKQALAHVEDLLSKQPGSIAGLTVKADLLADTGRHLEALAACNKAIDAFHARYPKSREPPHGLLLRRRALFAQVSRDRPKRD